jgi:GntR family transcriptional regulator
MYTDPVPPAKEPLYSIIATRAEERIRTGEWPPGTRLPPERELCRLLDVSRVTLRQALAELEQRGLISRHQGRGTFVTRPRVETPLSGYFSIAEALRARGLQLSTRVLSVETSEAGRQVAHDLGCLPGDPLVRLDRLRLVDTEPLVLETSYLPVELFPGLELANFARRSLYDILREDYGRTVSEATETIEPVITTPHESALLGLPRNAPAILTRRVTQDVGGMTVELGQALLRGDRSSFLLRRRVREVWPAMAAEAPAGSAPAWSQFAPDVADLLAGSR